MNRTTFASRTLIATAALTAVGLIAASPASAHTNNMYTVVIDSDDAGGGFSTYSKTDGKVALLPESTFVPTDFGGIEVAGEKGTAIGYNEGSGVFTWDHSTGTFGPYVAAFIDDPLQELDYLTGLDTLNNGTTVTLVNYEQSNGVEVPTFTEHWAIASINAGTGEVIPLLDITDAISVEGDIDYNVDSLATDPLTGFTYVFIATKYDAYFLEADVAGGTVSDPNQFDGFGEGRVLGADFDADGTLYFNYENYEAEDLELELSKLPVGSAWLTAERVFISKAPAQTDTFRIAEYALTIEHTALAATGSDVPVAAFLALGTVAVLAGGLTVMVARRRSERGTV